VIVNLALIPKFLEDNWEVYYIGSEQGIERKLIEELHIKYFSIATGKLRRYFDWNNFKDPFKVLQGTLQAYTLIKELKPDVIFSKGGFVSVPVAVGGWLNRTPVIIHESDITPGLANRLAIPFATKVCTTFPETEKHLKTKKSVNVGAVVREELFKGNKQKGLRLCDFVSSKPVLLVMGGSLGAKKINQAIRDNLDKLLKDFQVIHICGKGQVSEEHQSYGYKQFEYVSDELPDILAMSDLVITRAGSNSIYEFLALRKPMLLIPLSKAASRGDQILNAISFKDSGYCEVLFEENLSNEQLLDNIYSTYNNKEKYLNNMRQYQANEALNKLLTIIKETAK